MNKLDRLAQIAEQQREANGLPVFDFGKVYAAMSPEQKKMFWSFANRETARKQKKGEKNNVQQKETASGTNENHRG